MAEHDDPTPVRAGDTKTRLMEAAAATLRDRGLAGVSARTIADRAGVNQALIFYHFGSVAALLEASSNQAVDQSVREYRAAFAEISSWRELLEVGRTLHARERAKGNIALMAQVLSGAQTDPVLARASASAIAAWTGEVEAALRRVLAGSPAGLGDLGGLATLITAAAIGLELCEGADAGGVAQARGAVESLGDLADVMADLFRSPAQRRR